MSKAGTPNGHFQQHPMYETYRIAVEQYLSYLNCYSNPARLKRDINEVLINFPTMIPGYTHTQTQAIHFKGSLPVTHRSQNYNVPIQCIFPKNYPLQPPGCYILAAPHLIIAGQYVDAKGVITHPKLLPTGWNQNFTILEILIELTSYFAQSPPCVLAPANPQSSSYPQPPSQPHYNSVPLSSPSHPPSYPSNYPSTPSPSPSSNYSATFPAPSSSSNPQYPAPYSNYSQPSPSYPSPTSQPFHPSHSTQSGSTVQPTSTATHSATQPPTTSSHPSYSHDALKAHLKTNITNKHQKLSNEKHVIAINLDTSLDHQIQHCLAATESNLKIIEEMNKNIQAMENAPKPTEIDIDSEEICKQIKPISPLELQLLQTNAELEAHDDVLYEISSAYNRKADNPSSNSEMSLAVYLKTIRSIAKKQYFARALLNKINNELSRPF